MAAYDYDMSQLPKYTAISNSMTSPPPSYTEAMSAVTHSGLPPSYEQSINNNFTADSSPVSESADHCISLLLSDAVRPAVNTDSPLLYSAEHQSATQRHTTSLVQRLCRKNHLRRKQCIIMCAVILLATVVVVGGVLGEIIRVQSKYTPEDSSSTVTWPNVLLDACASNPCQNNGTCVSRTNNRLPSHPSSYYCLCRIGYAGTRCETQDTCLLLKPCKLGYCRNNGLNDYTCTCLGLASGRNCELQDYCVSNPCRNGGRCSNDYGRNNGYKCNCPKPYTGQQCQMVDICYKRQYFPNYISWCQWGNCESVNNNTDYRCTCDNGFTGRNCDTLIKDPCKPSPCSNGGTCVANQIPSYYNNWSCLCKTGFTGLYCDIVNDPCSLHLCQNGATCVTSASPADIIRRYSCICPPGFTGYTCNSVVSPCLSNPCQNNGTCYSRYNTRTFTCTCQPGYSGLLCDNQTHCLQPQCQHGQCPSEINNNTCVCDADYIGLACDQYVDHCQSRPCQNQAVCVQASRKIDCSSYRYSLCSRTSHQADVSVGFRCYCYYPYMGTRCEQADACSFYNNDTRLNCFGKGDCINTNNGTSSKCLCDAGFTGSRCNVRIANSPSTVWRL